MSSATTNHWQQACQLISQAGLDRGVHQTYPNSDYRLSLLAAANSLAVASSPTQHRAGQSLAEQLQALVTQAHSINRIGKCPVVGISGLLNSGKSSLLSAYLSPAGRGRVLRGTANNQGTHRFVLWLPEVWWREAELVEILRQYMQDLFGVLPEPLADEPAEAFAQYNGQITRAISELGGQTATVNPLQVPLLACDPGLNALGLALLDCPDIQTAFGPGSMVSDARLDESLDAELLQQRRQHMLGRIGRLCSAFLVVSKLSSLHDDTLVSILETLRDTMPGVRRILCVNKVKARYTPAVVDEQAQALVEQFQIAHVYMAYDFRSHWAEHRLPPTPDNLIASPDDPLPIFFRAAREENGKCDVPLSNDRLLAGGLLSEPGPSEPGPSQPGPSQPGASQPGPSQPGPSQPGASQPGASQPGASQPGASQPGASQPGASAPRLIGNGMQPPVVAGYLQDLAQLLNPGSLVVETRRSVLNQLESVTGRTVSWFETNQGERVRQLHDAWSTIASACYAFMAQRDDHDTTVSLRLQTSPAIVAQMSDSLVKAAPWTMRPSLWVDRTMRRLQASIASGVKQVRWMQTISSSLSNFVGSFRKGTTGKVVTSERFQQQLKRSDTHGSLSFLSDDELSKACEHALARFQKEDTTRLDQAWLDKWSKELWQHMSLKRMVYVGVMPLAPIFGPLLAVTLIPFDGGGSAVLVFATTKELLMAAGLAALATPAFSGGNVQDLVERETAFSQLSELFAMTCDALGVQRPSADFIPRVNVGGSMRELKPSTLSSKDPANDTCLSQWRLEPKFPAVLQQAFEQLRSEIQKAETE